MLVLYFKMYYICTQEITKIMKAINTIVSEILKTSSLRSDLQGAFEFAKQRSDARNGLMAGYEILTGEWIYSIDPENMRRLEMIKEVADDSYSLASLASAILNNKKIKIAG